MLGVTPIDLAHRAALCPASRDCSMPARFVSLLAELSCASAALSCCLLSFSGTLLGSLLCASTQNALL